MLREPEPELMDLPHEAHAYAAADFAGVNAAFVDRLMALAWDLEVARAVDLGAGPGDIAIRVARQRPQWHIDAVDASAAMIEIATDAIDRAGVARRVWLHRVDAKQTHLAAGYDVIFSNSLLHHMPDPVPMWREIRRLARPGAVIFLRDLLRPATHDRVEEIVEQYAGRESELLREEFRRSLLSAFTPAEIRAQLDDAGLADLEIRQATDRHVDVAGVLP
ncbi:MAG: class I SAM-dependent methyltransferase [Tepidisphaeraceae bacterium]